VLLLLGCFAGMGLTARLPEGVEVTLVVLSSRSSKVSSRLFLGLTLELAVVSLVWETESDRGFGVFDREEEGIMIDDVVTMVARRQPVVDSRLA
jgi:hypothetical protein